MQNTANAVEKPGGEEGRKFMDDLGDWAISVDRGNKRAMAIRLQ
jgi:hypothetical protein